MPGILPMKVIKVGTSAQSRIAQACDRCRSKKIRCDGFRPTCTQCANVGFECKTSDKLSRRAFPRGYTESLEERVRSLEGEVRELKDLLDEKDEKIEMLSKMHSHSPTRTLSSSSRRPSSISSAAEKTQPEEALVQEKEFKFKLQQSPYLIHGENTDLYFVGNSSSRAFMLAFKRKLQECGKGSSDFNIDAFFTQTTRSSPPTSLPSDDNSLWDPPSRLHSDQMVNIFFQEWAPLFPVLHRPTFLSLYEQYVTHSSNVQDKKSLAQLNLVFGIAALSNESRIMHSAELCERQWTTALDCFVKETSLVTLQCLVLAQIYYIQKGEPEKVLQYKGAAVAMAYRLGLHLSQKRFALGVLTVETRKKVFWALYAVDCFSSALLGLPKMLKEEDVFCEFPVDADDEYVTEKGFQPQLPGEFTKISSALALFRGCRILGKVLNQNYPAASTHELSLNNIAALDEELETWSNSLPSHLKLDFIQDKPATNVTSSRSPLLSLTYNFIRTLIHRPATTANLGERASSSMVALSIAHKQIVQTIQLLDERGLSFSHCLNKNELLLTSGVGLLLQSLELDREGKLIQDSQRLVCSVIKMLEARRAPGAADFKQLGCSMLSLPMMSPSPIGPQPAGNPKKAKSASMSTSPGSHKHIEQLAANYSQYSMNNANSNKKKTPKEARKSMSAGSAPTEQNLRGITSDKPLRPLAPSITSANSPPLRSSLTTPAIELTRPTSSSIKPRSSTTPSITGSRTNLDYFSFSDNIPANRAVTKEQSQSLHWDHRDSLANTPSGVHTLHRSTSNSVYDWPPVDSVLSPTSLDNTHLPHSGPSPIGGDGNDHAWAELWNFSNDGSAHIPQSVLSFSDESLTSGEEFSSIEWEKDGGFRTISIPHLNGHGGGEQQAFSPDEFAEVDFSGSTTEIGG